MGVGQRGVCWPMGCWPSGMDQWGLTIECWPSGMDQWGLAIECWPSGMDQWGLAIECWPSGIDQWGLTIECWPSGLGQWGLAVERWPWGTDQWLLPTRRCPPPPHNRPVAPQTVLLGSYLIAHGFLSVFGMCVDTLFLCFCELPPGPPGPPPPCQLPTALPHVSLCLRLAALLSALAATDSDFPFLSLFSSPSFALCSASPSPLPPLPGVTPKVKIWSGTTDPPRGRTASPPG